MLIAELLQNDRLVARIDPALFLLDSTFKILTKAWVKVFRIIPVYDFLWKVSLQMLNLADSNSFSDVFSVYLKTLNHLNLKLLSFVCILQV